MNIRSDYLDALRRQEQAASKPAPAATDAFGKMFTQEIGLSGNTTGSLPVPPPGAGMIDPMLLGNLDAEAVEGAAPGDQTGEQAMLQSLAGQASGLLNNWESYAQTLRAGNSSRQAWDLLSGMGEPLKNLRGELDKLGPAKAGLEDVVNELEVLTATETFKFNRGDYV